MCFKASSEIFPLSQRFFPADASNLKSMFDHMTDCQKLYPDPADVSDEDEEEEAGEEEEEDEEEAGGDDEGMFDDAEGKVFECSNL